MQPERVGDDIGTRFAETILEESVGEQVGRDDDAMRSGATQAGDRIRDARFTGGGVGQLDSATKGGRELGGGNAQVALRMRIRGTRRRENHGIIRRHLIHTTDRRSPGPSVGTDPARVSP